MKRPWTTSCCGGRDTNNASAADHAGRRRALRSLASSANRLTAFARNAAASRAITASPARSTRDTRRSSAAISSSSVRMSSSVVTAIDSLRRARCSAGRHSRLHRSHHTASMCSCRDYALWSKSQTTGTPDTQSAASRRLLNVTDLHRGSTSRTKSPYMLLQRDADGRALPDRNDPGVLQHGVTSAIRCADDRRRTRRCAAALASPR